MATQNGRRNMLSISLIQLRARSYTYSKDCEKELQQGTEQQYTQHAPINSHFYNFNNFQQEKNHFPQSPRSQSTHLTDEESIISDHQENLEHVKLRNQSEYQEDEEFDQDKKRHISSDPNESLGGSHTQSKTWVSWPQQVMDKWRTIQPKLMRMYPTERNPEKVCPFVPRDASQWCQHIADINAAEQAALERKMKRHEESKSLSYPEVFAVTAFKGKKFGSMEGGEDRPPEIDEFRKTAEFRYSQNPPTRGYVLAERTIWCPAPSVPWRQQPAWPCKAEMEWEGDQRVATENGRFGRYPPLPRIDPNNDSVAWHLKPRLRPYPFDEPWLVPTMVDIYLPVDEIEDPEVIATLLNSDLFPEIDNPPIPVRNPNAHLHDFTTTRADRDLR
jgi:hypothetical protein